MVSEAHYIAAIGNFDGVHKGHRHLIEETITFARMHGARPAALTFAPHPRRFFNPDIDPFMVMSPSLRDEALMAVGVEKVFELPFNNELAAMSPDAFILGKLRDGLGLKGVVAGADFRFGKGRAGGIEALQTVGASAGFHVRIAEVVADRPDAEKFSSSAVREALRDGDVARAAQMLGRPWRVRGPVIEGQRLGRTIGFATANIDLGDVMGPRIGVYATRVHVDGKRYGSVSNYGRRPTIGEGAPLLEAHLFGFDGDLYGKIIDVEFVAFLRDEKKFDGLDALKAQIAADCEAAKELVGL